MIVELPKLPQGDARVLRDALARVYDINSDIRLDGNRLYFRDTVTGEMYEVYMDRGTLMVRVEGGTEAWNAAHGVYGFAGRFSNASTVINYPGVGQSFAQQMPLFSASDTSQFVERNVAFDLGTSSRFWVRNDYAHEVILNALIVCSGTGGQGADYYFQWREAPAGAWLGNANGPYYVRQDDELLQINGATVIQPAGGSIAGYGFELWGWSEVNAGAVQVIESSVLVKRA